MSGDAVPAEPLGLAPYPTATTRERYGVKNRLYGPFRGEVRYNLDPLRQGRCKIRIPAVHSTETSIENADLPWAVPMLLEGGVHDAGHFVVPDVGATVFVLFEQGDPQVPLYLGGWFKNPPMEREINTATSKETGRKLPTRPISEGTWKQPIGPETPQEALGDPYFDPTTRVVFKSRKGAALYARDRDGFEELDLVDRSGQVIRLSSPLTDGENAGNSQQRGLRSALTGDPVPATALAGGTATIEILGRSGQGLRVVSREGSDAIEISSNDDSAPAAPGAAQNRISILAGSGLGVFEVVGVSKGEETARLRIDTLTGAIELYGRGQIVLQADILSLLASYLTIRGNVSLDGDLSVRGNLTTAGYAAEGEQW